MLSSGGFAYLTVRPQGGAWLIAGQPNYNLSLEFDGYGLGKPDGLVDWVTRVGEAQPGVPGWSISSVMNDPAPGRTYPRYSLGKRLPDAPPFRVAAPTMPTFPYLGIVGRDINYFEECRHPFYYRLARSEFATFPFIGMQSGQYRVLSFTSPPDVDFEAPFAWYNLDPASRYPQLLIRAWYYPATDPLVEQVRAVIPALSTFRYSWKIDDEIRWAYSLSVAGPCAYDHDVEIADVKFRGIPAERLADWIMSKTWPILTFVEAVDGYPGGEGIYYYSTQTADLLWWFYGLMDELPTYLAYPPLQDGADTATYAPLPIGFRGEYHTSYPGQPRLYFSPVDRRLHLRHAEGGVWNLGRGQVLRTHNLDGDAYVDGWTRESVPPQEDLELPLALPGDIREALYDIGGFLVYSGPGVCGLGLAEHRQASLDLAPPTDRVSWVSFREQMASAEPHGRDPWDLREWFDASEGTSALIEGGKIRGVRQTNAGFRFVLELQPDFQVVDSIGLELAGLEYGTYLVNYEDGFEIKPLTPARPEIVPETLRLADPAPVALEPVWIEGVLDNQGLDDAPDLLVRAYAEGAEGESNLVAEKQIALLAGELVPLRFEWIPPTSGHWRVRLEWDPAAAAEPPLQSGQSLATLDVHVASPSSSHAAEIWTISNTSQPLPVLLLLATIALAAASILLLGLRAVGGR